VWEEGQQQPWLVVVLCGTVDDSRTSLLHADALGMGTMQSETALGISSPLCLICPLSNHLQVGGRSVVNADIEQFVEIRPEADRFLRLLEVLGEWFERGKMIIFVHSQDKCDNLFRDLLKVRQGGPLVELTCVQICKGGSEFLSQAPHHTL
jgi:hypothetical protein